jgi:hypothetical protein
VQLFTKPSLFHSWRRDGERSGRMLATIYLKDSMNENRSLKFVDTGAMTGPGIWISMWSAPRRSTRGDAGPMLRVYNWNPWCISLGRHQDIADIDQEAGAGSGL